MRRVLTAGLALLASLMSVVPGATAATTTDFTVWGAVTGTTNNFATSMQLPAVGFPEATVRSDSRSDIALPSGATNWFGENTPPGLEYGSSRDRAYLNLRPRADNATSPSTTTYTFDRATPQGWAFVLGDIDADQVAVAATRADGTPATTAELGFRGAFNLCATTPRPSGVCVSNGRPKDVPTWNAATATLRGNDAAIDSDGATGWFEPTTPLRTLTLTFTRRGGFPVFQTWFAVTRQDLTGNVSVTSGTCDLTAASISLLDAEGAVVAQQPVGPTGGYAFTGVAASDGYRVALSGVPDSCISTGPSSRAVDLTAGDVTADFTVREVIPVPISGRITDGSDPLGGVTVTLTPVGGGPVKTTLTDVDGRYVFDDNPDDTTYTISVTPPDGYLPAADRTATIPDAGTTPITNQDFVLAELPSVSGTVTGPDGPLAGVTVELTGGGQTFRAVTGADGTYELARIPAGSYVLTVPSPPAGYEPATTAPVVVATSDVPGQDIALTRVPATGSVAGTVTLDGVPLAGVDVTIRPPGGTGSTVTTGADGTYGLGDLAPGTYEIVAIAPGGSSGPTTRTVTITTAGEAMVGQDFAFTTDDDVPVEPQEPVDQGEGTDPDDVEAQPAGAGVLPDTGAPSSGLPVMALLLMLTGSFLVIAARRRSS